MHVNVYFLSATAGVVALIWEAIRSFQKSHWANLAVIIDSAFNKFKEESFDPLSSRVSVMETKVDLVWRNITLNSIAVLHHPEPSRSRVDYLLDCFRDGTITPEETEELRGYLEIIMKWEEGNAAPFKIFQGEQSAAAMMLSTMDHMTDDPEETDGLSDTDTGSTEEAGTGLPE